MSPTAGMGDDVGDQCLWWLYFRAEPIALRHVSRTEYPVYASRMAGNGLLVLIAGLIALAAGNALMIDHPTRDSTLALALLLFGGPALFLLTQAWYLRLVFDAAPALTSLPSPRLAALVALEHLKTTDQSRSDSSPTSP